MANTKPSRSLEIREGVYTWAMSGGIRLQDEYQVEHRLLASRTLSIDMKKQEEINVLFLFSKCDVRKCLKS